MSWLFAFAGGYLGAVTGVAIGGLLVWRVVRARVPGL